MGTIFVAGIYGVGKSTLCQNLSEQLQVPSFSAGDLISQINGEEYGANKVVADKSRNQRILASQVSKLLTSTPQILLAGHFCIFDSSNKVDCLPNSVFYDLDIESILLLEVATSKIIENLSSRDNKKYTNQQISDLQIAERKKAEEISNYLRCKLNLHYMQFDGTDVERCLSLLERDRMI